MSGTAKVFLTVVLVGILFVPPLSALDEILALPVLAALSYIWGFAPTKN